MLLKVSGCETLWASSSHLLPPTDPLGSVCRMETDHFPNAVFTHHVLKTQTVLDVIMLLL